jgi:hypothetical protein
VSYYSALIAGRCVGYTGQTNTTEDKTMTKDNTYNGWTNKETWLVNVHYMDAMPEYFAESGQFEVDKYELADAVQYIAEECEALSQVKEGLLADFINDAWSEVNWYELAEHVNAALFELKEEQA